MSSTMVVGIAGINGKVGRLLASSLLRNPGVTVRGYCRNPSKVPSTLTSSSQVQLYQGDALDVDKIQSFVTTCDVVVCAYFGDNNLMFEGQKALIEASETAGVRRYVAGDWSIDYNKVQLGDLPFKDSMKQVRALLLERSTVKGVHILCGGFIEALLSPHFGILEPESRTFRYWGEGTEVLEGTTYENAADFTAAVILDQSAVGIQRFVGGKTTILELAQSFERVYGDKPRVERLGSLEDLWERAQALKAEFPNEPMRYLFLIFTYFIFNGQTAVIPETDSAKYPNVKPVTWEDFLKARGSVEALANSFTYDQLAPLQSNKST